MAEKRRPAAEIRELTDAEVNQRLEDAYRTLFNLRMRQATRQLENNQALKGARKQIARLKTIQTERRLGITRG